MSKRNSYALKSNEGNQIFHSWAECQEAIKHCTSVSYKAFTNDTMCRDWFDGKRPVIEPFVFEEGKVIIYTDGSFNERIPAYGWSFVAVLPDGEMYTKFDMGNSKELLSQRNIAGEMMAAIHAIRWAALHGYKTVELRYDYAGVGKISKTDLYKDWMEKIDILYVQIPGHSGDWYNEEADRLAKNGCRI